MSWEHATEARAALNAIVTDPEHGVSALSSPQTMSNLLKDLLPDAPREKSILVAAAEAGLADNLRQHVDQGMDPNTAIRLTASSFSSTTPFTPEACNWVTGEIATAMGISHSGGQPGGGAPGGFDQGQQGMPTQIAPIPGAGGGGYAPGQQPTRGFGQTPGQGGGYQGGQATAPGPWQGGGAQGGGYGQPGGGQPGVGQPGGGQPGIGQPGQPAGGGWGGYAQPGGAAGQAGYPGQPGQPAQPGQPGGGGWGGYAQPGGAGAQPGGYAQPGYGTGGPGGPTGPMGPLMPGGPGQIRPRNRRGLFIGGGIAAVVVVAVIIAVSLSGGGSGGTAGGQTHHKQHKLTPPPTTPPPTSPPVTSPATAPHPPGTDALQSIMNPAGLTPVGRDCVTAKLFGLSKATLDARTFCPKTSRANIVVWGYQFDNSADYQTGLAHINHFVGFDKSTPGSTCPPPSGTAEGKIGWHANHNPKYKSKTGQDIECLIDGGKPVLIWSMPTQDVFFIGQDNTKGTSIKTIINWWETLDYGQ
jgi:hypothetical protein